MKIQALAVVASTLASQALAQQAVQWKVEDGGNGHWYALRNVGTTSWESHRQAAVAAGAHLATVTSEGERNVVRSLIPLNQPGNGQNYSFGASIGLFQSGEAAEPTGGWTWVTGEPFTVSDWSPGEPTDDNGTEDWARFQFRGGVLGWNDTRESYAAGDIPFNPDITKAVFEWSADCNADGIIDYGQILDGTLVDADSNGVPDTCGCTNIVVRVPQDVPTIDAAADRACIGIPMEIRVAEGTWRMSVARSGDLRISIVGASRTNTVITQDAVGTPLNAPAIAGAPFVRMTLRNLTVTGLKDSENPQVGLEACDVRNCSATFLPGDLPVIGNLVVDCSSGPFPALIQSPLVMNSTTFDRCTRPVLLVTDGARAMVDCHFNDCGGGGPATMIRSSALNAGVNVARLDRCTFSRCTGGAVAVEPDGAWAGPAMDARFVDCTFTDNAFAPVGSAVRLGSGGGSPTVIRCRGEFVRCAFIRNSAPAGGAVWLDKSHPARFDSCTFTDNTATATDGGAIAQEFGGDLQGIVISGGTFTGNTAARHGGAIRCTGWSGALEVTNAHFTDNEAGFQGGAISIDRQSLAIADCTFTSNRAHEPTYEGGGAIFAFFSPEASPANTVFRSVFSGNSTPGRGGAIAFYYGVATGISDCTFAGNSAGHLGGAVVTHASCSTRMTTSRLSGNSAPTGAAIACIGANDPSVPVVRVEGCDFASNAGPSAIDSSATPAVELSGNVYCQSGTMPATGSVVEVGPSCTTATCTDFNNNGRPDGCECSSNPNLPSCCLGDIFSDGLVNGGDLGILLSQWGQSGVASDLDANGIVDGADLGLLLSGWGPCPN